MPSEQEPRQRYRWLAFSLRSLLLATTAFGIWLAWLIAAAERQKEVAEWVRSFNRTPDYSYELNASGSPPLNPELPIPQWLENRLGVDYVASIKRVHLDNRPVKDITLLARLRDLRHCEMADCEIKDLSPLAGLRRLEVLSISSNPIRDLSPLSNLKQLRLFAAMDTEITDLTALGSLPRLDTVILRNSPVRDLAPLAEHPTLVNLNLSQTEVTSLAPLRSIKTLQSLDISGTKVAQEEVSALQDSLPNCKITR